MLRRLTLTLSFAYLSTLAVLAQNFYQIDWTHGDALYSALVIWHSDDDAYARVGYENSKQEYQVAEFKCKGEYFTDESGSQYYLIDGDDAQVIFGDKTVGYSADNFIFADIDAQNHFENLYTIDDSEVEHLETTAELTEATFTRLSADDFTEDYLGQYFFSSEPQYQLYLKKKEVRPVVVPKTNPVVNPAEKPVTLHLVVVANSLDMSIGAGCDVDSRKLKIEFSNIAEALGISFKSYVIDGKSFAKTQVLNTVDALQPGSNDIVAFFYRGHGFRFSGQTDTWPMMAMRYSNFQTLESIAISDIYNRIIGKGARLNLVFGDMCNNDIGISQPVLNSHSAMQSNLYPSDEKLRHLFLEAKGNVLSVAAKPGEVSWVNNAEGGLYTSSFFEALYKEVGRYSGTGDWNALVNYTIERAEYKSTRTCANCTPQHGLKNVRITYE
jgi:hypothetical protein